MQYIFFKFLKSLENLQENQTLKHHPRMKAIVMLVLFMILGLLFIVEERLFVTESIYQD
jgi:hypothetical protein